jgi:hypothetical protein
MPTAADLDKALHREISAFRYDPGRHHRRRLAAGAPARLGGWQAEWPTLAALIAKSAQVAFKGALETAEIHCQIRHGRGAARRSSVARSIRARDSKATYKLAKPKDASDG